MGWGEFSSHPSQKQNQTKKNAIGSRLGRLRLLGPGVRRGVLRRARHGLRRSATKKCGKNTKNAEHESCRATISINAGPYQSPSLFLKINLKDYHLFQIPLMTMLLYASLKHASHNACHAHNASSCFACKQTSSMVAVTVALDLLTH